MAGTSQHDTAGRDRSRARNFCFFDAPTELIISLPARSVSGTFLDVGSFIAVRFSEVALLCGCSCAVSWRLPDVARRRVPCVV